MNCRISDISFCDEKGMDYHPLIQRLDKKTSKTP